MRDFFSIRKTRNVILWVGGILTSFIGLFGVMEGNIIAGLVWIGFGAFCFYVIWRRKGKGLGPNIS